MNKEKTAQVNEQLEINNYIVNGNITGNVIVNNVTIITID